MQLPPLFNAGKEVMRPSMEPVQVDLTVDELDRVQRNIASYAVDLDELYDFCDMLGVPRPRRLAS